ncbi:MAG: tyrosine-type recombinase/integrase [Nitrosomonas sp.]|nr:tyrosine-type recombinase/integrase [Nitrosomonas sp.]OQW85459.1 MAG: hypothetical protein BVN30_00680 [Proteobacteria bacterium ST_bin16]
MTDHDIQDGAITVTQNKTGAKLRINIAGDLDNLIRKISERKAAHKIISFSLIVDDKGQRLTSRALRGHFDRAREAAGINKESFQFRDLQAKAATDTAEFTGDIRQAQKQLEHTNITMTEHYVKSRKGESKPHKNAEIHSAIMIRIIDYLWYFLLKNYSFAERKNKYVIV